ncbi:MAG TPA: HD-GYP domain-containing protein, partial [Syntrophomonadaceae bacterium]|nr:HD-GYP domain-containing protein [Syntrophomonadaceae bacterium]
ADLGNKLGLTERNIVDLRLFAQFHDIGKVGLPDRILFKPESLTQEERKEMQRHSEIGHRIALSAPDLVHIADWILKHHEWWDGSGYPLGLVRYDIPLECRILSVADAYDAMTSNRPYRQALSKEEAVAELKRCSGIQFDPFVLEQFIEMLEESQNYESSAS